MGDVYVVTGGGRGIGAATVRHLAAAGHDVCFTWSTHEEEAHSVVEACRELGVKASTVQADVSEEGDVRWLFEQVDHMGVLRGLVNNAGILGPQGRFEGLDPARSMRILEVNVLGTLLCCREAVTRMSNRRGGAGGAIVNVSSRAAVLGGPNEYVDYAASKAGVDAITVGLAAEVAGEGIRVNGVRPALIRTDIHASGGDPTRVDRLGRNVPMGRGGEPEEVAAPIAWLLSDASSFVTGTTIDVAGGL
ncbi:MAG: SDR family oxidoreductase [Actinomycetota bacterium]|nr:SDR family oxidoreductase [Actinomycetota bacterium]